MSSSTSLTTHLLSLDRDGVVRATQHPFLRSAGSMSLSAKALSAWLTQDRLYAMCGYTRLMGNMIARLHVPEQDPNHPACKQWKTTFTTLSGALSNIHREINYFETAAASNGLSLSSLPSSATSHGLLDPLTKSYIDYMVSLSSVGTHAECAVLLWAMEQLYFQAWSYVSTFLPPLPTDASATTTPPPHSVEAATRSFIHNWTSSEFQEFVGKCREMVDGLPQYEREGANLERLEKVWREVLWYEERFWDAK